MGRRSRSSRFGSRERQAAEGESVNESANEDSAEDPTNEEPAEDETEMSESAIDESGNLTDEDLMDYESTPTLVGMDINMLYYLPAEFCAVEEEGKVAQLNFGPKNVIFEKPAGPVKHLKPL